MFPQVTFIIFQRIAQLCHVQKLFYQEHRHKLKQKVSQDYAVFAVRVGQMRADIIVIIFLIIIVITFLIFAYKAFKISSEQSQNEENEFEEFKKHREK